MREAKVATSAADRENVIGVYKLAGKEQLIALVEYGSPQALDNALSQLPLLKEIGHSLSIDILPIYPMADYIQHVGKALQENLT